MYNSQLYNVGLYGSNAVLAAPAAMLSEIEFNGYSLQSTSIITQNLRIDSMPARDLEVSRNPRTHGGIILNDSQRVKTIRLTGILKANTAAALETLIDTFKKNISALEGNLDYNNPASVKKRHVCTLINGDSIFGRREGWNITICPFDLTFVCYDPFGKSLTYNSTAIFGQTSLNKNETIFVDGTYEAEGVLIFVFNSASSITGLTFTNNDRSESMSVTTAISTGDVIIFDTETKTVTKNGVEIDYSGVFPIFSLGTNSYTIALAGGGSANWDLTLKYLTTYL